MTVASIRKTSDETWVCVTEHGATHFETWSEAQQGFREYLRFRQRLLDPGPTHEVTRRLQALQAQGYAPDKIARWLGTTHSAVDHMTLHGTKSATTARLVREKYAWVMRHTDGGQVLPTGPTDLAKSLRWVAPAGWSDIDNPDDIPDCGGRQAKGKRDTRTPVTAEHRRMIAELITHFGSTLACARHLGFDKKTLVRAQTRGQMLASSLALIEHTHRLVIEEQQVSA